MMSVLRGGCSLWIVCLLACPLFAQEWTRFRGPNGTGASEAAGLPTEWTADDYAWQIDLPGVGHSSPVIWGEKIFVTSGDPETGDLLVLCLDAASGKQLWQERFPSAAQKLHARNSFASSTPAVDADHLYLALVTPTQSVLQAINHAGEKVWQHDLGPFASEHGYGTSPIVVDNLVIINNDNDTESSLVAVDRQTGKQVWQTPRKADRTAYSTPCVRPTAAGPSELIFNSSSHGIAGVDLQTGKTNWELQVFDKRSVSSPIVVDGLCFGSCGSGGGGNYVVAVRPASSDSPQPELVYKVAKSAPYVPTPIAYGDLAFLWSDQGVVTCIDAGTGETHWQKRVGGNYSGSPVRVQDRIYCISEAGEVVVLAAHRDYELLARNDLGDNSRATPAIANGRMFLRTEHKLFALEAK